ncbi:rod shape-determining protein MreC [Thermanaerovibrio acidaminovorans]|jgi:rod shape-determining protein MreC|uniref:rod shape-determining protein MreC n=1 Tax=Thermanaerovibrio acidaminovorans TaxID=81462 RepID=UPI0024924579|nr:rod shape-determining protein MreC [Thermanaerovibrio acidaminovorans]
MKRFEPLWIHGLMATLVGLSLTLLSLNLPLSKALGDPWCQLLSWPERPALQGRLLFQAFTGWLIERKSMQERLRELEAENLAMRRALSLSSVELPQRGGGLLPALVTLRYPEAWWSEVRLDKGSADGVSPGDPVLSSGYLVGIVSSVKRDHCWVRLLTAEDSMVAVVVDQTRDLGVLTGDGMGRIFLNYLPPDREVNRDMTISTALMGGNVPPGVPVGRILSKDRESGGFVVYNVALMAHLTQLYWVDIMISGDGR